MALVMIGPELIWHEDGRIRNPDIYFRIGIGKPCRQHSNHGVWLGINPHLFTDNAFVAAEPALEEAP